MTEDKIKECLQSYFQDPVFTLKDLTGTQDHWRLEIQASEFAGKTMVQQHKEVYKALGDLMHNEIHALSLDTSTP